MCAEGGEAEPVDRTNDLGPDPERPAFVDGPRVRASRVSRQQAEAGAVMFQAVLDAYAAHGLEPRGVQAGRREWTRLCTEGDGLDVDAALAAIKRACERMAGFVEDARKKGDTDPGRFAKTIPNLLRDAPWADAVAAAESKARIEQRKPAAPIEPPRRVISTADWVRLGERLERAYGIPMRSALMIEADARRAGVNDPNDPRAVERVGAAMRTAGAGKAEAPRPASSPVDVGAMLDALAGGKSAPAAPQRTRRTFATRAVDKPE